MALNRFKKILLLLFLLLGLEQIAAAASESAVLINESLSDGKVHAINNFKLSQFVGTWYELARIPVSFENRCQAPITAQYTLKGNEVNLIRSCATVSGIPQVNDGVIYLNSQNFTGNGTLLFSLLPTWLRWTTFGRNEIAVIYLSDEYLLLGATDQKHLWVFSRNETPPLLNIQNLIELAKYQGFPTTKLIFNYPAYFPK